MFSTRSPCFSRWSYSRAKRVVNILEPATVVHFQLWHTTPAQLASIARRAAAADFADVSGESARACSDDSVSAGSSSGSLLLCQFFA